MRGLRPGTRSLLLGAHQFILHPCFVALAWHKLYGGWPRDPRIWVAFLLHDIGYWGKWDMDGASGASHPLLGANLMGRLFDRGQRDELGHGHWWRFTACHSRTFANIYRYPHSTLMAADKLATVLMPLPLYAALCWLSGEWLEYRERWVASGKYPGGPNDDVMTWARHLRDNWRRFERPGAVAGKAYGGE